MSSDPNDFLLSGGIPGVKWPAIGTIHKGIVHAAEVTQQTEMKTGEPKSYKDGNPMMQLVVTLQTDETDAETEDDNGLRRVFIKGQMKAAVADAVRKANSKLEKGGILAIQYVSDKPSDVRGFDPAKQFVAQYKPAELDTTAANDLLGTDSNVAAVAPAAPVHTAEDLI